MEKFTIKKECPENEYFMIQDGYVLGGANSMSDSENVFEIQLFDLANDEWLLNALSLVYMTGNYGVKYTYKSRAEWFARYLASFRPDKEGRGDYLESNPIVKLLVTDRVIYDKYKKWKGKEIGDVYECAIN